MEDMIAAYLQQVQDAFEREDPNIHTKALENRRIAVLKDCFRAMIEADEAALSQIIHPDCEMNTMYSPPIPFFGYFQGRDAVVREVMRNMSRIELRGSELLRVIAQGDVLLVSAREQGVIVETGEYYDVCWMQMMTFDGDQLRRIDQLSGNAVPNLAA